MYFKNQLIFEFIDFIDSVYRYVQSYIFEGIFFAKQFQVTLYGGMLGNFAEGSAPAHTVLLDYISRAYCTTDSAWIET